MMKTVILLAGLVALALGATVPQTPPNLTTKTVDAQFVQRQTKVLSLVQYVGREDPEAEYYKVGKDYDIEANINNYTNKKAVEEFLRLYRTGTLPKGQKFSIFYDRIRDETVALFHLFYYAKDFETFYKTAAFARVHLNVGQFLYSYYIAVIHRDDTNGIILPPVYEVYPYLYVNSDVLNKIYRIKMQDGIIDTDLAKQYGAVKENDDYIIYANYSNSATYSFREQRLSYFTEDIGLNSYYYYFHAYVPFWWSGDNLPSLKGRRGEGFFYFYQQLLARYYLERLTNGLGEIPDFSWNKPIRVGYTPLLSHGSPWPQRNNYYYIDPEQYEEELQWVEAYEKNFLQYLERGQVKAYGQEVDLHNSKAINFVGNYWQSNADLYGESGHDHYDRSYQIIARRLLGAAPEPVDTYNVLPSALEMYQTSLRDPAFYQLYSKILGYVIQYKENIKPYTNDDLQYVGVKINDVKVEKLVTYFDYFDFDATNAVYLDKEEIKTNNQRFWIRQPRLNHKPFTVSINVKSDVASDAVVKIFLGPKYDSNGYPISLEDNWMNFVELDWFVQKLTVGQNTIERSSNDFFFYKQDSISSSQVLKLLEQGKVPNDMSEEFDSLPNRLMLPKGTTGGYPFQIYVIAYPQQPLAPELAELKNYILDNRPLGWPFDRPIYDEVYYTQPNIYTEDVAIYHEGALYPYVYNIPGYVPQENVVPKQ